MGADEGNLQVIDVDVIPKNYPLTNYKTDRKKE